MRNNVTACNVTSSAIFRSYNYEWGSNVASAYLSNQSCFKKRFFVPRHPVLVITVIIKDNHILLPICFGKHFFKLQIFPITYK